VGDLWLVRHGQTAWSVTGQHTGRTDLALSPEGEDQARGLAPRLDRPWAAVLCSPLQRAWRTAELAGLAPTAEPDLVEWDYGPAEGRTTAQMSTPEHPWRVWDDVPLGETAEDVAIRVRRVLAKVPAQGETLLSVRLAEDL
jgi:probable phosphoglycerate mutase